MAKEAEDIINLPVFFAQVDLRDKDIDFKREAIKEQHNNLALISDEHYSVGTFLFARISYDADDRECYSASILNKKEFREPIRLHYHDLEGLMISSGIQTKIGIRFLD